MLQLWLALGIIAQSTGPTPPEPEFTYPETTIKFLTPQRLKRRFTMKTAITQGD